MRRSKDVNSFEVIMIIALFVVWSYYLIKLALILIIYIICLIIVGVRWIIRKKKEKNGDLQSTLESQNNILEKVHKSDEEQKLNSSEVYKTKYDDMFEKRIRTRGLVYYLNNKFDDYRKLESKCTCISNGEDNYETEIYFNDKNEFSSGKCTCPYYQDGGHLCKHIYCLLLKYYFDEKENVESRSKYNSVVIDRENNNEDLVSSNVLLERSNNFSREDITDSGYNIYNTDEDIYKDIYGETYDEDYISDFIEESGNDETKKVGILEAGLSLFDMFDDEKKKQDNEKYEKEHENLKKVWGLNDYEADLVQEGRYNPWNFGNDKEDLEEDDYHYEDDI